MLYCLFSRCPNSNSLLYTFIALGNIKFLQRESPKIDQCISTPGWLFIMAYDTSTESNSSRGPDSIASDTSWSLQEGSRNGSSLSFLSENDFSNPRNSLKDMRALFETLSQSETLGPRLIRLKTEFNQPVGHGGQGIVYGPSKEFENKAEFLSRQHHQLRASALVWNRSVVKRLRHDDGRDLGLQVRAAHNEIKVLCHESLRKHPNIVDLLGWGLCLDTLEAPSSEIPLIPLLIFERAHCDLGAFIRSFDYKRTPYIELREMCLAIGRGLGAVHEANVAHGDIKPENILIFPQKGTEEHESPWKPTWIPKLCDFASAIILSKKSSASLNYQGTVGWRPPDFCSRNLTRKSLQACDVFAYGLVVAAIFRGKPSSPIQDLSKAAP